MSFHVIFRGVDKSDIAETTIRERISAVTDKFPEAKASPIKVTLEMENSPQKAGLDVFTLTLDLRLRGAGAIIIKKSSPSMYTALADICESALERLNREGDRRRVKNINKIRKFMNKNALLVQKDE